MHKQVSTNKANKPKLTGTMLISKSNKPTIFNKKSNIVVSKRLTYIGSDTGKTRHFTPAAQE
jgi:hypothetical protein